jgi:hypothetical protein
VQLFSSPPGQARTPNAQVFTASQGADIDWMQFERSEKSAQYPGATTGKRRLVELHMKRTWKRDEVDGTLRYDFSQTADVATKDLIKLTGSWRRDYAYKLFSIYRPTSEYNRAFKAPDDVAVNYLLLQQEIGAGVNVFTTPQRKLRVGLSENLFDVWVVAPDSRHVAQTSESIFAELEWSLPWRLRLMERGVWYPPFRSGSEGWENRLELNKKLTETLSVAIRHETRTNNPDVRIQDYTLLRLLVGLDF